MILQLKHKRLGIPLLTLPTVLLKPVARRRRELELQLRSTTMWKVLAEIDSILSSSFCFLELIFFFFCTQGYSSPSLEESNSTTSQSKQQQSTQKSKDAGQDDVTTGVEPLTFPKVSSADDSGLLSEHFDNMKISGKPTTLPKFLQDEYYRSSAMVQDDPQNLAEDSPFAVEARILSTRELEMSSKVGAGDYRARTPGDGSETADLEEEDGDDDVTVGYGGVTYYRSGRGDILPGYPTPEGMRKLISDRMMDDQLRLATGKFVHFSRS